MRFRTGTKVRLLKPSRDLKVDKVYTISATWYDLIQLKEDKRKDYHNSKCFRYEPSKKPDKINPKDIIFRKGDIVHLIKHDEKSKEDKVKLNEDYVVLRGNTPARVKERGDWEIQVRSVERTKHPTYGWLIYNWHEGLSKNFRLKYQRNPNSKIQVARIKSAR